MTTLCAAPETLKIQTRYSGRAEQIYMDICFTLSERIDQVGWADYTANDWSVLARMVDAEGVAPLVYWNLKDHRTADDQYDVPGLDVPPEIFRQLKTSYYNTLAQNTLMYQELERILQAFDEAGIPVIVLKGAALAVTVYEDIGLRPMGDLDLLVLREDIEKALPILYALSYYSIPTQSDKLNRIIGFNIHLQNEVISNTKVELHWGLITGISPQTAVPIDWLWTQIENLSIKDHDGKKHFFGATTFKLSPTANLLYSIGHLMLQHEGINYRLLWIYDIKLMIQYESLTIDWDELVTIARDLEWNIVLRLAIIGTRLRFNTPLSDDIINNLGIELSTPIREHKTKTKIDPGSDNIGKKWDKLLSLSAINRIRFLIAKIFPSPKYMRHYYNPNPTGIWPIYYLVRWNYIFQIFVRFVFRRSVKKKNSEKDTTRINA